MPEERSCGCASALKYAILTDRAAIPPAAKERLGLLVSKYL
jgi:5'-methylthioadenosine phosphorylase